MARKKYEILIETTNVPKMTFDENGVLKGVLICGYKSENGYEYTQETFNGALLDNAYENAGVFLDHPNVVGGEPEDRKGTERLGVLKNTYLSPEGLRGDYHAITSHPMYQIIKEDFEKGLGGFSFSHVAKTTKRDGKITEIKKVYEVDICTCPNGTTTTLLETDMPEQKENESHDLAHNALMMAIESVVKDDTIEPEEKKNKIGEHIDNHYKLNAVKEEDEEEGEKEEVKEEVKKETLEINNSEMVLESFRNEIAELKKITELQSKYFVSPMSVIPVEMVEEDHMTKLKNQYKN